MVLYKEDVFQAFDSYHRGFLKFGNKESLTKERFLVHYCKKFKLPYQKHQKQLRQIFDEWVKEKDICI